MHRLSPGTWTDSLALSRPALSRGRGRVGPRATLCPTQNCSPSVVLDTKSQFEATDEHGTNVEGVTVC